MGSQDKIISRLLIDESFIRWLNNESESDERKKWNNWKNECITHQVITEKAKKIISMPFTEETYTDEPDELKRLMKNIEKLREENN